MCCANRTFWFNLILWVIAILGLAPVADEWAKTFEGWTGVSLITRKPVIIQYCADNDAVFYAHVFGPDDWDDPQTAPALVTFCGSPGEQEAAYALGTSLAELGYVSISFEFPDFAAGPPVSQEMIANTARQWLDENAESLGIAPTRVAVWARGDSDSVPARLALCLFPPEDGDSSDSTAAAAPSTLVLVWSRHFSESAHQEEQARALESVEWSPDDIPLGIPVIVALVAERATQEQLASVGSIEAKMARELHRFVSIVYESDLSPSDSVYALRREAATLAEAIHDALQSLDVGSATER